MLNGYSRPTEDRSRTGTRLRTGTRCGDIAVSFRRMTSSIENSPLKGQVVLITGGARRIGAEITRTLHAAGASVLIHYRSSAAAAMALSDECNRSRPGSAAIHAADLSNAAAPDILVAAALAEFGRLDILINNASSFYPDTGRQDHHGALGRSDGQQLASPAVSRSGRRALLGEAARTHHQYSRHPRLATPEGSPVVQHRQGGARDADALAWRANWAPTFGSTASPRVRCCGRSTTWTRH